MAAAAGAGSLGLPSDFGGPPLTAQMISRCLREKYQEKEVRITEPSLDLAVFGVFGVRPTILRLGEAILRNAKNFMAVSALCAGTSAVFLYVPWSRDWFLRGLVKLPLKQGILGADSGRGVASRGAQLSSLLGFLSVGGCIASVLASNRLASMREALPSRSPPAPAAGGSPLCEEGPTAKEKELQAQVLELEARLRHMHLQHEVEQEAGVAELRSRLARAEANAKDLEQQLGVAGRAVGEAKPTNGMKESQPPPARPRNNGDIAGGSSPPSAAHGAEGLRRRAEVGAGVRVGEAD